MGIVSVESLNVNLPWGDFDDYLAWSPGGLRDSGWLYVETDEPHGTTVTWGRDPAQPQLPGSFQVSVTYRYQVCKEVPADFVDCLKQTFKHMSLC